MSDRPAYPRRPPFFAQKFVRLLLKQCVANELGHDVFMLLTAVVSTEDAAHYRPVTFFNGQLLPILGFRKWERLDACRREATRAGWLCYLPPPPGSRDPGQYWVTVPPSVDDLPDTAIDEGDPIAAAYARGYDDCKAGRPPQVYPVNGDGQAQLSPANGYGHGYGHGYGQGEPPYLSLSLESRPAQPGASTPREAPPRARKSSRPSFTPEDRALAEWFWSCIHAMQPDRKAPNLEKWADEFRLMRERDHRKAGQVRELFERVQQDGIWRLNILSPATLRDKFDDLRLKFGMANGVHQPSAYRELAPIGSNGWPHS